MDNLEEKRFEGGRSRRKPPALYRVFDYEYPDGEQVCGIMASLDAGAAAAQQVSLMEETGTLHMNVPRADFRPREAFPLWGALRETGGWSAQGPSASFGRGKGGAPC